MQFVDCHVHSHCSWDGRFSPVELCRRAVEVGLAGLVFTEHLELDVNGRGYDRYQYDRSRREIEVARETFPQLYIGMGLEVSYRGDLEPAIRTFLAGKDFDMLIASVHEVEGIDCSDPDAASRLWGGTVEARRVLRTYFSEVRRAIDTGLFDVVGHLGVFLRLGRARWEKAIGKETIDEGLGECLCALAQTSLALEVNTSGVRLIGDIHPGYEYLRLYRGLGGWRLTLGSDAHRPAHLAGEFAAVAARLVDLGFESALYYCRRQPVALCLRE